MQYQNSDLKINKVIEISNSFEFKYLINIYI